MAVVICLLRGVNVVGRHTIRMSELRALCESLGQREVQTHINSGNVLFRTASKDLARLGRRIEGVIERSAGFRPAVMLRTVAEMREVVARNPFDGRRGIEPNKFAVVFLASEPDVDCCGKLSSIEAHPEELHIRGRELYIYYANGFARPKLAGALIEKTLKTPGTARNWNTVRKLLELAEEMEASAPGRAPKRSAAANERG